MPLILKLIRLHVPIVTRHRLCVAAGRFWMAFDRRGGPGRWLG